MKKVLITGGAGFIGSNFVKRMLKKHDDWQIVNLDKLTYAGSLENLCDVIEDSRHVFVKGDIADRKIVDKLFFKYNFDYVINFAAESHVDRSIEDPEIFLKTNIMGTQCLLDSAKKCWQSGSSEDGYPIYRSGVKYLQVSTDEVYGSLGRSGFFSENSPLAPNSPYSASKASADLIARSYYKTFKMPVNITRCSNNYGPYQFPEKLIPLMICNAFDEKSLPVYGDGLQIRDWLHVYDHCDALEKVVLEGREGEVYNIGGNCEKTNIEIVKLIIKILNKSESLISHVKDRLGHDRRYAIDSTKIKEELGWEPLFTFEKGMSETIKWYLESNKWVRSIRSGQYIKYYNEHYSDKFN